MDSGTGLHGRIIKGEEMKETKPRSKPREIIAIERNREIVKSDRISVAIEPDIHAALKLKAKQLDRTDSWIIRQAIVEYLNQ